MRRYDSGQSRDSRRDKDVDFRRRGDSRTDSRRSGGSRTDSRRRGGSRTDSRRRAGSRADSRRRAGSRGAEESRRRGGSRTDSRRRCGSRRSNRLQEAAIRDGQRWEKDHEYARRGEQVKTLRKLLRYLNSTRKILSLESYLILIPFINIDLNLNHHLPCTVVFFPFFFNISIKNEKFEFINM